MRIIKLHPEDEVWGNYLLMTSGPITHIPHGYDHLYVVSERQIHILEHEEIRYSEFIERGKENED